MILLMLLIYPSCDGFGYRNSDEKLVMIEGRSNHYTIHNLESEEELKYPKDANTRNQIKKLWNNYYDCLDVKAHEETKPEIHRLVEGQFIEFQCPICRKPFQNYNELEWKYRILDPEFNMSEPEHLDLTSEMELTENKSLRIYNAIEDISGLYACYLRKNLLSVYILEVSKNDTLERVDEGETEESLLRYESNTFLIYYKWYPWTECSSCKNIGRKFQYGSCFITNAKENFGDMPEMMVKLSRREPRIEYNFSMCNNFEKNYNLNENNNKTVGIINYLRNFAFGGFMPNKNCTETPINEENVQTLSKLVQKFSNGLPCYSTYVTNLGLEAIRQRPAVKVRIAYCRAQCEDSKIFAVLGPHGKILEIANNSAGIYSAYQKMPKPPPEIDRRSVTAEFGSTTTIQCPRTILKNIPVTWKINNKIILPEIIANESNGRLTIDLVNRIHIKKLRLRDNHIYSCWQRDRLVGTVRLNVEKKFKITFDHHVTLLILVAFTGLILMVGSKLIVKELNNRCM